MIVELGRNIPTEPGHYFGRQHHGLVSHYKIDMATGDELWNDKRITGLVCGCSLIENFGPMEWSEKISFRVTME